MSKGNEYGRECLRLRNSLERFYPLLEKSGEFCYQDISQDIDDPTTLHWLESNGALNVVRREQERGDVGTNTYNVYTWNVVVRRRLKDYWDNADKLPCGHQVHIFNDPEVDGLGCKHCAEDNEHPEYSKDMVRELL